MLLLTFCHFMQQVSFFLYLSPPTRSTKVERKAKPVGVYKNKTELFCSGADIKWHRVIQCMCLNTCTQARYIPSCRVIRFSAPQKGLIMVPVVS